MAEKETELPRQASQRGAAVPSEEGKSVRQAIRAGETPDPEQQQKSLAQSGYRYPDSYFKPDPELEAQKQVGTERGLTGVHERDKPDTKDPAVKQAQAAAEEGASLIEARNAAREEREAEIEDELKDLGGPGENKALSGPTENKTARKSARKGTR